jgi:hypothetical protein
MRSRASIFFAILAASPPAAAQAPVSHDGWHLGGGAAILRFGPVASAEGSPGEAAEIRPSGRVAVHLGVGRTVGPWDVGLELGWAGGHIEAGNDFVSVHDLTSDATRYRLSLAVGRCLMQVGTGTASVELVPTLDLWSLGGDSRSRAGAEGRLVLRVPLGRVELEHRIGLGLSGSPIESAELGEVAQEERGLRTLSIGLGLRTRL